MIQQIIEYNREFVKKESYKPYITSKYPDKKLAILTCMDTRLTELLPAALGIRNGDAKIIKNAGGVITHPYGSVVRSLLVALLELGVQELWSLVIQIAVFREWMLKKCWKSSHTGEYRKNTLILSGGAELT